MDYRRQNRGRASPRKLLLLCSEAEWIPGEFCKLHHLLPIRCLSWRKLWVILNLVCMQKSVLATTGESQSLPDTSGRDFRILKISLWCHWHVDVDTCLHLGLCSCRTQQTSLRACWRKERAGHLDKENFHPQKAIYFKKVINPEVEEISGRGCKNLKNWKQVLKCLSS